MSDVYEQWARDAAAPPPGLDLKGRLIAADDLDGLPDPQYLIDGVLVADTLAFCWGRPGSGKSFVALDWACCVSLGAPWDGRETRRGAVLYLAAEGVSGLKHRVQAWKQRAGVDSVPVRVLPCPVQVAEPGQLAALLDLVEAGDYRLIIIDTQARCTVGVEENSNGAMGKVVHAFEAVRQASGACVVVVHHGDKAGNGLRGASALEGAADTVIKVVKDGALITVECEKQKDDAEFGPAYFRLVETGNSAALEPVSRSDAKNASETKIIAELCAAGEQVTMTARQLQEATGLSRATINRAMKPLTDKGFVEHTGSENLPRYKIKPGHGSCPSCSPAHHRSPL